MKITVDQLTKIYPASNSSSLGIGLVAVALNTVLTTLSPRAGAMFIAQTGEESAEYTHFKENLNYSGDALYKLFKSHFRDQNDANRYHREPERIANRIYSNRMGNGNEASGDGWKYRGRGFIQCTGKTNYTACGENLKLDLLTHPELLETLPGAMDSALWYWNSRGISKWADLDDVTMCTKLINGGSLGIKMRTSNYALAKQLLGVT